MSSELNELGVVRVATPCRAKWSQMKGTDTVRHCQLCNKNVYHLSRLTSFEARDLLLKTEGRLCVRFFARADGTVLTKDCEVGIASRRRQWFAAVAMVLAATAAALQSLGLIDAAKQVNAFASDHELRADDVRMRAVPSVNTIEGGIPGPQINNHY